ncbi:hypothetical protein QF002_000905 [Paraburkholderia youngii]
MAAAVHSAITPSSAQTRTVAAAAATLTVSGQRFVSACPNLSSLWFYTAPVGHYWRNPNDEH